MEIKSTSKRKIKVKIKSTNKRKIKMKIKSTNKRKTKKRIRKKAKNTKNENKSAEKVVSKPPTIQKEPTAKSRKDLADDEKTILDYLIQQNRPYSGVNIFENLNQKIKKAQCLRILDNLTKWSFLICKEYNTKVYLPNQNNYPPVDEKELKTLDEELEIKRKILEEKQLKLKKLQADYKAITSKQTDEEIKQSIINKNKYLEDIKQKVLNYKGGNFKFVDEETVKIKEKIFENSKNNYQKARKVCLEIVDGFCELMEKKRKEIFDMMGLEEEDEQDLSYINYK